MAKLLTYLYGFSSIFVFYIFVRIKLSTSILNNKQDNTNRNIVRILKLNQTLKPHPDNGEVFSDWLLLHNKTEYTDYVTSVCRHEYTADLSDVCDCVPSGLVEKNEVPIYKTVQLIDWRDLEAYLIPSRLQPGGHWTPDMCVARRRVAIIVPFRDRENHLKHFISHNVPMWQRQMVEFRIFVIEQNKPQIFNKGALMNAGFNEAEKRYDFDCVLFHDVDMLSSNDLNIAQCGPRVLHYGPFVSSLNFRLLYFPMFGGAVCMTRDQYRIVNGYSNDFAGWGGEDDDMFHRVNASGLGWVRPGSTIGRFRMIRHRRDEGNPENKIATDTMNKKDYSTDISEGLRTVKYSVQKSELRPLYTWILVDVLQ